MKSQITFIEAFGTAFLSFNNGVAEMHHDFFTGTFAGQFRNCTPEVRKQKCKAAALAAAKKLQPSVEEALNLTAPEGFVFAGINHHADPRDMAAGFRAPARKSVEEKKTDSRIGKAAWMLYRLSTGLDATFVPAASDWTNKFASPRGAAARITQPHQIEAHAQA